MNVAFHIAYCLCNTFFALLIWFALDILQGYMMLYEDMAFRRMISVLKRTMTLVKASNLI